MSTLASAAPSTSSGNQDRGSSNAVVVNIRQKGNPLLQHVRNVVWTYGDATARDQPDYILGTKTAALFLSLKFHRLKPDYIHDRLKKLPRKYALLVVLALVDVDDSQHLLRDLNKICLLSGTTLMLAWSYEEAARYIEVYKMYEHKSPDLIMGKSANLDDRTRATEFLTCVKSINKTDAMHLLATFGTLSGVLQASEEDLAACQGIGPLKARNLFETFTEKLS